MNLADTNAALAASARLEHAEGSIRAALAEYSIGLEDVEVWAAAALREMWAPVAELVVREDGEDGELAARVHARAVGQLAAAVILGIELERNLEVT